MDAAVSLHHHGALATAAGTALPPHHRALHLRHPPPTSTISARLTVTAAQSRAPRRSSSSAAPAPTPAVPLTARSARTSTRAATGYAAALADASLRAGTLPGAARHARALLRRFQAPQRGQRLEEEADGRVGALVRMLVGKGKGGMVAEVLAEFAAICDHLLAPLPASASSKQARSAAASY